MKLEVPTVIRPVRDGSVTPTRTVLLVGAGGGGARLVPLLAKGLPPEMTIHIYDDDIVEVNNLARQNFIARDVGRHKAEVLATRYSFPGGPRVIAHVERVTDHSPFHEVYSTDILIGCVDNTKTRALLLDTVLNTPYRCAYIDCGNAMHTGQVTLSGVLPRVSIVTGEESPIFYGVAALHGMSLFPNLTEAEDDTPTCAARMDDQTIAANQWCATIAYTLCMQLRGRTQINGLGAVFDATTLSSRPIDIKRTTRWSYDVVSLYPTTVESHEDESTH